MATAANVILFTIWPEQHQRSGWFINSTELDLNRYRLYQVCTLDRKGCTYQVAEHRHGRASNVGEGMLGVTLARRIAA